MPFDALMDKNDRTCARTGNIEITFKHSLEQLCFLSINVGESVCVQEPLELV